MALIQIHTSLLGQGLLSLATLMFKLTSAWYNVCLRPEAYWQRL